MSASAGTNAGSRVAIFGPGLIGGSVAMALRRRSPETVITVWGRNPTQLEEVLRRNLADSVETDPAAAVKDADLVILCTPIDAMEKLAASFAPHLEAGALVTDAGSVKACVVRKLTPLLGDRFLGGHPMAGSERSGLAAARSDLFESAPCILTPTGTTLPENLQRISLFWQSLGARVTTTSPWEHDSLVARLSHLPHAMSFALVNLVADSLPDESPRLAGGSFRDATRVAASDPVLWTGILSENRHEVIAALKKMSDLLSLLARNLEEENQNWLLEFITRAKEQRERFPLPDSQSLPESL